MIVEARITEALDRLIEGNARFARAAPERRGLIPDTGVPPGPSPLAAVLGCSDPRVPPESIFDLAIGGLFVVRVAGHVLDDAVIGSLEFAAEYLQVPLIVVLGHSDCRAVRATVEQAAAAGSFGSVLDAMEPAVLRARALGIRAEELVAEATVEHVRGTVADLRGSRVFHPLVDAGILEIRGALYHGDTGTVEWFPR
jgi:carbonic anhydrase